jgi:hypothetical protein
MTDHRIEKWTRWIDGSIKNDVLTMHLHRDAWRTVAEILDAHGHLPPSYWWEFMRDTYATTQAVAVRRQADTHRDVASLGKLITELADDTDRITREFWIALWRDPDHRWSERTAQRAWEEQFAGSVGEHLDPTIPRGDLDALRTAAASVKAYVDEHVAHAEAKSLPPEVTLTLKQVHDAVDVIGDLFKRYYNLLTASSYLDLVPVIQDDWLAVFRVPWIAPSES